MKIIKVAKRYRYVFAAISLAIILLIIIVGLFSIDNATNEMIVEYIEELGWEIEATPKEITYLTIPKQFDAVYETYNAVQKHSGFNLEEFKGKKVTRYTYRVLNHKESKTTRVIAGVFVYENTIIAGDISSADVNGFLHAITETSNISRKIPIF